MVSEKKIINLKKGQKGVTKKLEGLLLTILGKQKTAISKEKEINILMSLVSMNIFTTSENAELMAQFNDGIKKAFMDGVKYSGGSAQDKVMRNITELVTDNVTQFTSKLGDDIKGEALKIVQDGIKQELFPDQIKEQLVQQLQIKESRAKAIARTETMRASNAGGYIQAKSDGMTHYVIDNRDEACEYCQEYEGETFEIDDQENIPPYHPNCACVAVYFNDKQEAQGWSDMLQQENQDARAALEEKGYTISPDGTGATKTGGE